MTTEHYDVIIIGTGAGGGTLAHRLAPSGKRKPQIQQLADDFEKAGHRPFHLPVGVDLKESDPETGDFDGVV